MNGGLLETGHNREGEAYFKAFNMSVYLKTISVLLINKHWPTMGALIKIVKVLLQKLMGRRGGRGLSEGRGCLLENLTFRRGAYQRGRA